MRWRSFPLRLLAFGSALILLLSTAGVGIPTATAQESVFDVDAPVALLRAAHPNTDEQLVGLATALMKARADTEIRYSTYRKGVRCLQLSHPEFYGNFFGDSFYASYDIRYQNLVRERLSPPRIPAAGAMCTIPHNSVLVV